MTLRRWTEAASKEKVVVPEAMKYRVPGLGWRGRRWVRSQRCCEMGVVNEGDGLAKMWSRGIRVMSSS